MHIIIQTHLHIHKTTTYVTIDIHTHKYKKQLSVPQRMDYNRATKITTIINTYVISEISISYIQN